MAAEIAETDLNLRRKQFFHIIHRSAGTNPHIGRLRHTRNGNRSAGILLNGRRKSFAVGFQRVDFKGERRAADNLHAVAQRHAAAQHGGPVGNRQFVRLLRRVGNGEGQAVALFLHHNGGRRADFDACNRVGVRLPEETAGDIRRFFPNHMGGIVLREDFKIGILGICGGFRVRHVGQDRIGIACVRRLHAVVKSNRCITIGHRARAGAYIAPVSVADFLEHLHGGGAGEVIADIGVVLAGKMNGGDVVNLHALWRFHLAQRFAFHSHGNARAFLLAPSGGHTVHVEILEIFVDNRFACLALNIDFHIVHEDVTVYLIGAL